ncbi:MAG: MarR family transcriptional regulator [Candidatus Nanohaloarchaea archaeon]|nr:MarR family transcriptional regulator [Candidatus Nanohaloarchaea archaeon]
MADDSTDGSKKDELVVMRLIAEGKDQVRDLQDSLDWSRDRVEETVDDLQDHEYVEKVQDGGDQVLAITERGREHLPKLFGEVMDETREFVEAVSGSFQKHMSKVFPSVSVDVDIDEPEAAGEYECDQCGETFDSERGMKIHAGMEH